MKTACSSSWVGFAAAAVLALGAALASCGGDGSTPAGGAGGAMTGAGGAMTGAGGASMVPTVGPGGWDCLAGTTTCDCTHSPATSDKTGTCTGTFPCCRLLKISAGVSWYCQCDQKDSATCDADIKQKDMASGGNAAWRVAACPVK